MGWPAAIPVRSRWYNAEATPARPCAPVSTSPGDKPISGGVRSVVDNSLAVTNAYFEEHTGKLRNDSLIVASTIDTISPLQIINPLEFGRILENIANKLSADILAVEISREPTDDAVTELGSAKTRFTELTPPTESEMSVARSGEHLVDVGACTGQQLGGALPPFVER